MASTNRAGAKNKTVCLLCRQRKIGCDRRLPRCGFCSQNNVDCQYVTGNRTPGLRAGYVSQLELRLEELERRVKDLEQRGSPGPQNHQASSIPLVEAEPSSALVGLTSPFGHDSTEVQGQNTPSTMSTGNDAVSSATNPLSPILVNELCGIWFERYHPWFPILHQPSLWETLQTSESVNKSSHCLVINAIVAVTVTHSLLLSTAPEERQRWSEALRDKVVVEAIGKLSLQSIQALLILSNLEYGSGKSNKFWNFIALCKRGPTMSLHLGLRDFVVNQGSNFSSASMIPPRLLPLPYTIIDREERVRAYWMTEILYNISTLGSGWNTSISPPEITATLPCSDSIWAFPEHIINIWSMGEFHFSSAFSLCIILSTSELLHVHRFLQRFFNLRISEQWLHFQAESQQIDERLTTWRGQFVAAVFRLINAEHAQEERAEMDPNIVLTNCILDCAVIVLFQRLAPCPTGIESACETWTYATNRCVYACDDLSAKVRLVHDNELEVSNPHLIFTIFVAARFYLLYAKAVNAELPRNLQVLVHALHICGKRWELARRYETILKTAAAEHRVPVVMSSLPQQFFDPQVSTLDIDEALRMAAEGILPASGLGTASSSTIITAG